MYGLSSLRRKQKKERLKVEMSVCPFDTNYQWRYRWNETPRTSIIKNTKLNLWITLGNQGNFHFQG